MYKNEIKPSTSIGKTPYIVQATNTRHELTCAKYCFKALNVYVAAVMRASSLTRGD